METKHWAPKAFRQYSKRYGAGVRAMSAEYAKYTVPTLDRAASARRAKRNIFGIDPIHPEAVQP